MFLIKLFAIPQLILKSFLAVTIMSLLGGSGLIMMYIDDNNREQEEKMGDEQVTEYTHITMEKARTIFDVSDDICILQKRK